MCCKRERVQCRLLLPVLLAAGAVSFALKAHARSAAVYSAAAMRGSSATPSWQLRRRIWLLPSGCWLCRGAAAVVELNLELTDNSSVCSLSIQGKAGALLPELLKTTASGAIVFPRCRLSMPGPEIICRQPCCGLQLLNFHWTDRRAS